MPGGDRTGPLGQGPMTGRAAGFCAGNGMPGYANPVGGGGAWGRGAFGMRGGGRGWRNRFYATGLTGWQRGAFAPGYYGVPAAAPSQEAELTMLKRQSEYLEKALKTIQDRINELES